MVTNNSSNATNAQYNLIVGTGSAYTSIAPSATVGEPLCSAGSSADPAYSATPVVDSITINDNPASSTDGVNKAYADLIAAGFTFQALCYAATTANLTASYDNGTSGVGATLTNSAAQAAFTTDGTSPPVNSRILVKDQTNQFENGIYTLTTVGDGSTNWVLTRATDYDTTAEIQPGDMVPVQNGTAAANTFWVQGDTVTTIGTDSISFTSFGALPTYPIEVSLGGTDATAFTANGVVISNTTTTGALAAVALSDGQVIIGSTGNPPAAATLTAGTNITLTNAANSITIAANQFSLIVQRTSVNAGASPYTVLSTDYYLAIDSSAGPVTLNFPNTPTSGQLWVVKDEAGSAGTNNITITTPGGSVNFDGATTYVLNINYEAVQLIGTSTPSYGVF